MAPLHIESTTPRRRMCSTRPGTNARCSKGLSTRRTSSGCFVSWLRSEGIIRQGCGDREGNRDATAEKCDRGRRECLLSGARWLRWLVQPGNPVISCKERLADDHCRVANDPSGDDLKTPGRTGVPRCG